MSTPTTRLAVTIAVSLLAAGCRSELAHDLEEPEANRLVAVLEEAGIAATTSAEGQRESRTWVVSVASGDLGRARAVLRERDLPDRPEAGIAEVFEGGGLLPTPTEERARLIRAVQGELVRSLESVDGVLAARVHIALSSRPGSLLPIEDAAPEISASVLLRYAARDQASGPPLTEAQVRALVAGAVEGLAPERISVVAVAAPAARVSTRCQTVAIGPYVVSPGSATALKASIGGAALLVGLLGLALVAMTIRLRGLRRALQAAAAELGRARALGGAHSAGERTNG